MDCSLLVCRSKVQYVRWFKCHSQQMLYQVRSAQIGTITKPRCVHLGLKVRIDVQYTTYWSDASCSPHALYKRASQFLWAMEKMNGTRGPTLWIKATIHVLWICETLLGSDQSEERPLNWPVGNSEGSFWEDPQPSITPGLHNRNDSSAE